MSNFANICWSQILLGFWIESFLLLLRVSFYLLQSLPCIGEHRLQHNRVLNNIQSKHKSKKDQILNNIQSKGEGKILEGNGWKEQSKILKGNLKDQRAVLVVLLGVCAQLHKVLKKARTRLLLCAPLHERKFRIWTFCKPDMSSYFSSSILCCILAMSTGFLIIWRGKFFKLKLVKE